MIRKEESEENVSWAVKVPKNTERTNMLIALRYGPLKIQRSRMKKCSVLSFPILIATNQSKSTVFLINSDWKYLAYSCKSQRKTSVTIIIIILKSTAKDDFLLASSILRNAMNFSASGF